MLSCRREGLDFPFIQRTGSSSAVSNSTSDPLGLCVELWMLFLLIFIVVIIHRICAKYNGLEINLFRNCSDPLLPQILLCHAQGFGLSQDSIKKTALYSSQWKLGGKFALARPVLVHRKKWEGRRRCSKCVALPVKQGRGLGACVWMCHCLKG